MSEINFFKSGLVQEHFGNFSGPVQDQFETFFFTSLELALNCSRESPELELVPNKST